MKLIISILFHIAAISSLFAQSEIYEQPLYNATDRRIAHVLDEHVGSSFSNTWNIGSAKKLSGRIYVLEVWLTSPGTSWSKDDMGTMQYRINNALAWLKRTAARYSVDVEFIKGSFHGDGSGVQLDNLPRSYDDCAKMPLLMPRALREIGYADVMQCYNLLTEIGTADNVITLMLINNDGWANANQFSKCHAEYHYRDYFLESVNIFKTDDGEPTTGSTIAHEILHLFGAWDMYGGQVTESAGEWANQNYPNEIMLQVSSQLDDLMISPLTAWLVGLSSEYHDWYWKFKRVER